MYSYIANGEQDKKDMLKVIGVDSIDDLFSDVPSNLKLGRELNIDKSRSELEVAKKNKRNGFKKQNS